MRVVHPELNFPEELEDLGGDPLLYLSSVCLPTIGTTCAFPGSGSGCGMVFAWRFQNLS